MNPSVRGAERTKTSAALAVSAAASAALTGFVLGAAARTLGVTPLPGRLASAVVALAVLADLGPTPICLRRQVPRVWGRLLTPTTAAALYGTRLGIGPLTILATWLWWAGAVVAASAGPWWSAAAGGVFGLTRVAVMVAATAGADHRMAARMASVRRREELARRTSALVGLSASVLVALPLA